MGAPLFTPAVTSQAGWDSARYLSPVPITPGRSQNLVLLLMTGGAVRTMTDC